MVANSIQDAACFEDGSLVLNSLSWETHLLNSDATQVLDLLRDASGSEPELMEELLAGEEANEQERARYGRLLSSALSSLETLGLIEVDDESRR